MKVTVAGIQCELTDDAKTNSEKVTEWIVQAVKQGAQVVLPSELFEGHYFCSQEREEFFSRSHPVEGHPLIGQFSKLAAQLKVVIPVSFFERAGQAHYNSVAIVDADGQLLGVYRKSHIPDGPGYEEKYYFRPGDTGFKVWQTRYARLGVGICWDQWFPECARAMTLQGADLLLYPTAIGSEPNQSDPLATKDRWQKAMVGHAVCNVIPVIAANRIGKEGTQHFYGHSFVCNEKGTLVDERGNEEEGLVKATFDLKAIAQERSAWGFFRDRRPDLYGSLLTADGALITQPDPT